MKIWQKNHVQTEALVEAFTVGRDREFDLLLAPFDVQGSLAHAEMLFRQGLLRMDEWEQLREGLLQIQADIAAGDFDIPADVEDVHSQVESLLIRRLGEVGKKLHTGRSRNDQVALDIKLYLRHTVLEIRDATRTFAETLLQLSEQFRQVGIPGYTHLQIAMPSTFGLWFGCYAESLVEDLELLAAAYHICNRNPLGSGAGYGSSFPLDRDLTTGLLGMERPNINAVYAQMSRGKTERIVANACASLAATLGRMAMDICLYLSQNFGFFRLPAEISTGSSLMPHKQNPDLFELVRARCSRFQNIPGELTLLQHNLPSGYHRDLQFTKEILFPALASLQDCLEIMQTFVPRLEPVDHILDNPMYRPIFSVDAVNRLVQQGVPFRDAYRQVGSGTVPDGAGTEALPHTHLGSAGNPGTERIRAALLESLKKFDL